MTIKHTIEHEEIKQEDEFKINLDNPGMEPCCADECNILPTFELVCVCDGLPDLHTYICQSHFNYLSRRKNLSISRIIVNWIKSNLVKLD